MSSVKHNNYVRTGGEVTVILRICDKPNCDKIDTKHIDGHWSRKELGL